jgi:kinesin family protein C2/C3
MTGMQGTLSQALSSKLQGMMAEFQNLVGRYKKEVALRKQLHNQVQELKGNIRVYMRARPPSKKEVEQFGPDSNCVTFQSDTEVKVLSEKGREKVWEFDRTFDMDSTQEEVYKEVSPLVTSAIDGYAVCIFAYGQTGSGKTFTMNGPEDMRGVNTRALDDLFHIAKDRSLEGWEDVITVSVLEVYNEKIHDLLSDEGGELEIRQSAEGNYVPGLTSVQVNTLDDVDKLMKVAEKHRSQQATNMNEHSSRSHMMLSITIASHNRLTGFDSRGRLHLVDLAGSERLNKTGAEGKALKEAQNINKSLSALGDVIAARANKQGHVPFRNSTLTYLLQDALSQDSKTLMFVCASPVIYNAEETYCSLNFAARVRTVELGKATKNTGGPKKK